MGRDRWAQQLLTWTWAGNQLRSQIARCTYHVQAFGPEILAWAMRADISGGRRVDVGSYPTVSAAKAACDLHAAALCRREADGTIVPPERGPVDVRIAPPRR
jgi:hypothetical protein